MQRPRSVLLAVQICLAPAAVFSQVAPQWESEYIVGKSAGDITSCVASIFYNNASFLVRLYGDNLDFIYQRDDFTLPYGKVLGVVRFFVDGQIYNLGAWSFDRTEKSTLESSQIMQLIPRSEDAAPLFNALKFGTKFAVVFPNGDTYPISLSGSSNALSAASNCWSRNKTGDVVNNPFIDPEKPPPKITSSNPFESL